MDGPNDQQKPHVSPQYMQVQGKSNLFFSDKVALWENKACSAELSGLRTIRLFGVEEERPQ